MVRVCEEWGRGRVFKIHVNCVEGVVVLTSC